MHLATLLTLPLLAAAVPAMPPSQAQGGHAGQVPLGTPSSGDNSDIQVLGDPEIHIDLDLNDLRLVKFSEEEAPVWITELDKIEAKAAGRNFMDITDTPNLGMASLLRPARVSKSTYPEPGKRSKEVEKLSKAIDVKHMEKFLAKFTGFRTRYYKSDTGRDSQRFLKATIEELAKEHGAEVDVRDFTHPWGQPSIIASFASDNKDAPVTIIGAHQDSTNMWPFLPAPGADDDGSGTTSALEAYKALVAGNFTPSNPLEFHWYSAEEAGLLGSQAVVADYSARNVRVNAMLQMDMTAWVKKGTKEVVGIVQDWTDADLTKYVTGAVDKYLDIPAVATKIGYAASDHASWTKAGYPSAFAIESTFEDSNHYIHSTNDRMDISPEFSIEHMSKFSKLCVAFAVELTE